MQVWSMHGACVDWGWRVQENLGKATMHVTCMVHATCMVSCMFHACFIHCLVFDRAIPGTFHAWSSTPVFVCYMDSAISGVNCDYIRCE